MKATLESLFFILLCAVALVSGGCVSSPGPGAQAEEGGFSVRATGYAPSDAEWARRLGTTPDAMVGPAVPAAPEDVALPLGMPGFPEWAEDSISVREETPLPEDGSSYVQRMAIARRVSHETALHEIARRVMLLAAPSGGEVGVVLSANPDLAEGLEVVVGNNVVFEDVSEVEEEKYVTRATLPLRSVALLLFGHFQKNRGGVVEMPTTGVSIIPPEESKQLAYDAALKKARQKMLQAILAKVVAPDYSVAEYARDDQRAAIYVRSAVENAPVTQVQYPDARTCMVTITTDLTNILRTLKNSLQY